MRLGLLLSGNLGFRSLEYIHSKGNKIEFVLTDSKSIAILDFCDKNSISIFAGNPRSGKGYDFIKNIEIDVLASVNYLFLIEEDIINHPKQLAFNIHGSLLPKYRGRTPHVWSIINDEEFVGVTVHKIDSGCDTGDIILQEKIEVEEKDTGATILRKFDGLYFNLIDTVFEKLKAKTIIFRKQDESKATFFGKRTPKDGEINWDWQKRRIYNWIRAQAYPYPGAFTHFNNQRVIIDQVEISETGFDDTMPNGLIVNENPLEVKCPNGVLRLITLRENYTIRKGERFTYNGE
jgi:methionyl-tRNA formyltransferase